MDAPRFTPSMRIALEDLTLERLAEIRGLPPEELAAITVNNANRLLTLPE